MIKIGFMQHIDTDIEETIILIHDESKEAAEEFVHVSTLEELEFD